MIGEIATVTVTEASANSLFGALAEAPGEAGARAATSPAEPMLAEG